MLDQMDLLMRRREWQERRFLQIFGRFQQSHSVLTLQKNDGLHQAISEALGVRPSHRPA